MQVAAEAAGQRLAFLLSVLAEAGTAVADQELPRLQAD
jgi:hypothetical protein